MWKWSKLSWPIIYIAIFPICEQQSISLTFFKFLTRGPETRFNFEILSGKKDLLFLRRIFLEGEVSLRKVVRACRYRSNPAPRFVAMVPVSRYCVDSSFFGCHSNTKRRINQPEMRRPKKKYLSSSRRLSPQHPHSSRKILLYFHSFHSIFSKRINPKICKSYSPLDIIRIGYFQIMKYLTTSD